MITGTPPPVASMSTKPGARAVTLQAAQAGSAAAGEAGQPRSRRMTAPGRISTPHVPIASFTAVSGPPFGRSEARAQTASPARTISAKGIGRGAGSSACSRGATTARRPRARTSLSRTRRPFRTSGGGPHCGDTLVTAVAGLRRCRLALRGPLEVPPEQLDEARVRLRVAVFELDPGLCAHRLVGALVGHCVSGQLERPDAEKVEHVPESLGSPGGEILHGQGRAAAPEKSARASARAGRRRGRARNRSGGGGDSACAARRCRCGSGSFPPRARPSPRMPGGRPRPRARLRRTALRAASGASSGNASRRARRDRGGLR